MTPVQANDVVLHNGRRWVVSRIEQQGASMYAMLQPEFAGEPITLPLDALERVALSRSYLGDGVYAEFDGWNVVLTAENGLEKRETIYLDPDVYGSLKNYVARIRHRLSPNDSEPL